MMGFRLVLTLFVCLFYSCNESKRTVYLIKQWHLSPKFNTLEIESSKLLPQFKNQRYIYDFLVKKINEGEVEALISEGCEGEIDSSFAPVFYGWDYKSLEKKKSDPAFGDILAHMGVKIEALMGEKFSTHCGDNIEEVKKHGLALSEVRGHIGFYLRLKQFKEEKKTEDFERYSKRLLGEGSKEDPIAYAKKKVEKNFKLFKEIIKKRNKSFVDKSLELKKDKIAIVIGGIHADDLKKQLEEKKFTVKVITPEGYPENDTEIFEKIEQYIKD